MCNLTSSTALNFYSIERPIGWCRRICIENLPENINDEQINQLFQETCGQIESIDRGKINNYILITFFYLHSADAAVLLNTKSEFQNNDITIKYAQHDSDRADGLEIRSMLNQIISNRNHLRKNPINLYQIIYGIFVVIIILLLIMYIDLQQENSIVKSFINDLRVWFSKLFETNHYIKQNHVDM